MALTVSTAQADETFSSTEQLGGRPRLRGEKPAARSALMRWVLIGYFAVLAMSIAVPFAVAWWLTPDQVDAFQQTTQSMNGLSQGLFGILGVVVGYYFKEGQVDGEHT